MSSDIKTLIKLLNKQGEKDLANVLLDCGSYIDESTQYGTYLYSVLSTFVVLVPAERFLEANNIVEKNKDIYLKYIKYIYPDKQESPEIIDIRIEILKEKENEEINKPGQENIHIFISYSTKDKDLTRKISNIFEDFKISFFLAHEDIEVTEEWEKIIISNLFSCNVFIPILTINYKDSNWVSQELGVILGKKDNTLIIPLKKDIDPFGFISHLQAGKIDDTNLEKRLIKKIYSKFPQKMFEKLLDYFECSASFREAESKLKFILYCLNKTLETNEINRILKVALSNEQILFSFGCKEWIVAQIKENKKLDEKLLVEFKNNDFYKATID